MGDREREQKGVEVEAEGPGLRTARAGEAGAERWVGGQRKEEGALGEERTAATAGVSLRAEGVGLMEGEGARRGGGGGGDLRTCECGESGGGGKSGSSSSGGG